MRTTIDLPEDLFREAKTRAVQQGTTLKKLMTEYIRSGLRGQHVGMAPGVTRRPPPPVAIHRIPGSARVQARTNRQLNTLLEEEEVRASRAATQARRDQP